jgi:hypothetical protein
VSKPKRLDAHPLGKYDDLGMPAPPAPATPAATPAQPLPADLEALGAAIRAKRPQPEKPEAPVYGRRRHGFVQLGLTVSPESKERLRRAADAAGVSMSELLDALLDRHLPR